MNSAASHIARPKQQKMLPPVQKGGMQTPTVSAAAPRGPHYAAGPAMSLGAPMQTKLEVNRPGDSYEQQADAVANHVTSGAPGPSPAITALAPGSIAQARVDDGPVQKAEAKKPEPKKPEEKKPEEKKPVQKADAKKPEPKKQEEKKPEEKKPVQKAETKKPEPKKQEEKKLEEKKPVQKDESRTAAPVAAGGAPAAEQAMARGGTGRPMNSATRETLESRMGADLRNVRVYDGEAAHQASAALGARAFTQGNGIWLGRGESDTDLGLMAHESTHVVQQAGGAEGAQTIRRKERQSVSALSDAGSQSQATTSANMRRQATRSTQPKPPKASAEADSNDADTGEITAPGEITFNSIAIPAFKLEGRRGDLYNTRASNNKLRRRKNFTGTRSNDQRSKWKEEVGKASADEVKPKLEKKVKKANKATVINPSDRHVFKFGKEKTPRYFIGDLQTVAKDLSLPTWDREANFHQYHVDHIVELQLADWPDDQTGNDTGNMELLDSTANMQSGGLVLGQINAKVDNFKRAHNLSEDREVIKNKYDLVFKSVVAGGGPTLKPRDSWSREADIRKGTHIVDDVKAANLSELGKAGKLKVFSNASGGVAKSFNCSGPSDMKVSSDEKNWLKPYVIISKNFLVSNDDTPSDSGEMGTLKVDVDANHPKWEPFKTGAQPITMYRMPGAPYAGYIDKVQMLKNLRELRYKGLSPIVVNDVDVGPDGLMATGQIMTDIPLLRGVSIDFEINGDNVTISKTFSTSDFTVPKPLVVSDSSLTISAGTKSGLKIEGQVDFGVERVGEGYLKARASTSAGLDLEGKFTFDSKLFDPAEITMTYCEKVFRAEGHIGVKEGKVRGIKSAKVDVAFSGDTINATGIFKPDIPAVEQGSMAFHYAPETGIVINGRLELKKGIPGIASGWVDAELAKPAGTENWIVKAHGEAISNLPGARAVLVIDYNDGVFDIVGTGAYAKGMLAGTITIGVTNRVVGADGVPGGLPGKDASKLTLYGAGSASLRIAPWLQATAKIRLLANGEVEVVGEIGLPGTLNIFDAKEYTKNIFQIGLDIPIVGVAAAGQRIGIFANITGGLDFNAGIGPGQLQELGLSVMYNPAHEDQTHITGGAKLHIPAHAGLRLFVRGGLGVGIPIVSAQAGPEIGASIGLEGAMDASVQVDWTPRRGLKVDALGDIHIEPKLKFDITGFVLVEADLLVTSVELYNKRWQLAAFEYGSNLRLGMKCPVHYEENKPFQIAWNDVQFEIPKIEPKAVLEDMIKKIK